MTPERNASCPCGSGKKYKKCCGGSAALQSKPIDYVNINRMIAYQGDIGRKRQTFCEEYTVVKRSVIQTVEAKLAEDVAASQKTISCTKGCPYCCSLYILASLQECEAIVYYLYRHEDKLSNFIKSYKVWQERIDKIERTFRKINTLHSKTILNKETPEEREIFNAECKYYATQNIACPFLIDGACSIYEVRPYACAGVVSISPSEWCQPLHPCHDQMLYFKTELKLESDMPYFVKPRSGLLFANMPTLVHDILHDGYEALSSIPGLENLKTLAYSDPQVQDILQNAGLL
jgi:hypothetical protein